MEAWLIRECKGYSKHYECMMCVLQFFLQSQLFVGVCGRNVVKNIFAPE